MKTIAIILFLMFMWAPLTCICQHFVPALNVEKTVAGCEYGASVSYQTKRLITVGAFYQRGLPNKTNDIESHKDFAGVLLNIPIAKSQNINFYIHSRFGLVDKTFLVFVPGVETEIKLIGNVWINAGAGLRMTYPSLSTKISFKI